MRTVISIEIDCNMHLIAFRWIFWWRKMNWTKKNHPIQFVDFINADFICINLLVYILSLFFAFKSKITYDK